MKEDKMTTTKNVWTLANDDLIRAVKKENVTGVQKILLNQRNFSININYIDETTRATPLILATKDNFDNHILSELLQHGADPNIASNPSTKLTALHHACRRQNIPVIKLLLSYKANTNCQDKFGCTPLDILLEKINFNSHLFESQSSCVKLLLDNHASVNIDGMARVFNSIVFGKREEEFKMEICRLLSNSNVDINM